MKTIELKITSRSKDIPDEAYESLYDLSLNGVEISPKDNDFPMPWDAVCYIEDGFFIIDGDMGQQGSDRGWAKVGIPLDKVHHYIDVSITTNDEEEEVRNIFTEYGWL